MDHRSTGRNGEWLSIADYINGKIENYSRNPFLVKEDFCQVTCSAKDVFGEFDPFRKGTYIVSLFLATF